MLEAIDFSLELIDWFDRAWFRAVCFSMAPAPLAAVAITVAFVVKPAHVRANPVKSLVNGAVCHGNGSDGSNGNSEFHFCVGSLFLII